VPESEAEAWDSGAADWVALVRSTTHGAAHDASIRSLIGEPAGLVVDAGCGEGRLARELRALGHDVAGFDRSARLVEEARAADPGGRYEVAELDSLPLADGAAACVACVNVLMHVDDLDAAAAELVRVCAEGGSIVLGLLHPTAAAGRYDEERDELRVDGYFAESVEAVPLGHGEVFHTHRTLEQYLRPFFSRELVLDGLHEVPGRTGSVPRYLDLRLTRLRRASAGSR
jgi:SAM-dependent methyltransferase